MLLEGAFLGLNGELSRPAERLADLRTRLFPVGFSDLLCCFSAKTILQICHALPCCNMHRLFKATCYF